MPTRSQNTLFVLTETVLDVLDPMIRVWAEMMQLSLSARSEHNAPNMAVLLLSIRKSRNVSQMELGTNRARKDGSSLFDGIDYLIPVGNRSGFFSLIANIEQGGRKSEVSSDFLQFVANILNVPVQVVIDANAEDAAIRTAFAAKNRK